MKDFRHDVWTAFGELLREVRTQRGLTQNALADDLLPFWPGSSQSALAKMERGERHVGIDHFVALVWLLRVPPDRLLPSLIEPDDAAGNVAVLREELDRLADERDRLQEQYDRLQYRILSLDLEDQQPTVVLPEGAHRHGKH